MDKILSKNNNFGYKFIYFLIGSFWAAFIYNLVFVRYNIVVGGLTGLAIIFKNTLNIDTSIFIGIGNVMLIIVAFIYLSKKEALNHIIGAIVFTVMVNITDPITNLITYNMEYKLLILFVASVIYGAMCGLIFRAGYSCGGLDIIEDIISYKSKKPITTLGVSIDGSIILLGTFILGPVSTLYAIMVTYVSYKFTHYVMFGVSTKKMVYVISKKNKTIEDYIMNNFKMGATEINVVSGLFEQKKQMLLCVVHNTQYEIFKKTILSMDKNAFILSKTCYEVNGGFRYSLLPF